MKNIIMSKLHFLEIDWLSVGKSYLSGLLAALTVYAIMHHFDGKPVKVGTVNITSMVDKFVREEENRKHPPDLLKKEVSRFGKALERELKDLSNKNQLVLFPNEAVISGSHDYTAVVSDRMQRLMSHEEI